MNIQEFVRAQWKLLQTVLFKISTCLTSSGQAAFYFILFIFWKTRAQFEELKTATFNEIQTSTKLGSKYRNFRFCLYFWKSLGIQYNNIPIDTISLPFAKKRIIVIMHSDNIDKFRRRGLFWRRKKTWKTTMMVSKFYPITILSLRH